MIILMAGHVDHGKSTLIQALTGKNETDRLPEEKKRGMTIDLGFSYCPTNAHETLAFIDVPGHEKFFHNLLSGVGGIEQALLVIAADDGVMPQTTEHLALLYLLRLRHISIVISKIDKVSQSRLDEVFTDIRLLLSRFPALSYSTHVTSILDQTSIHALKTHLLALRWNPNKHRPFRLAIDRAFLVKGAGLVVTGTAWAGTINVDDSVWLNDLPVRIRQLYAQHQASLSGHAGQRLALNLTGVVKKMEVKRGHWLHALKPESPITCVTVNLRLNPLFNPSVHHWQAIHCYHGGQHSTGHLSLLEPNNLAGNSEILAEIHLDQPWYLVDQDQILLRDASAHALIGAAHVLECSPPKRGKRQLSRLGHLARLQTAKTDQDALLIQAERQRVDLRAFSWERQQPATTLKNLLAQTDLLKIGSYAYSPSRWKQLSDDVLASLTHFHQQHPDQLGVGQNRLQRLAHIQEPPEVVSYLWRKLLDKKQLTQTRGYLHLPEHHIQLDQNEAALWQHVEPILKTTPTCWLRDLSASTSISEDTLRTLLRKTGRLGYVHAIVPERYVHHTTLCTMADQIRHFCGAKETISASDFRTLLGSGRKLAIQILEYFDRCGLTRRQKDQHWLRDKTIFSANSNSE